MANDYHEIAEIFEFLTNYPLKPEPYPEHYPEDLQFDLYPGKDFVVGFCEEAIDEFSSNAPKAKSKEMRNLMLSYVGLFKTLMAKRLLKLKNVSMLD